MRQVVVFSWAEIAAQLLVENTQVTGQHKSVLKMLKTSEAGQEYQRSAASWQWRNPLVENP